MICFFSGKILLQYVAVGSLNFSSRLKFGSFPTGVSPGVPSERADGTGSPFRTAVAQKGRNRLEITPYVNR